MYKRKEKIRSRHLLTPWIYFFENKKKILMRNYTFFEYFSLLEASYLHNLMLAYYSCWCSLSTCWVYEALQFPAQVSFFPQILSASWQHRQRHSTSTSLIDSFQASQRRILLNPIGGLSPVLEMVVCRVLQASNTGPDNASIGVS